MGDIESETAFGAAASSSRQRIAAVTGANGYVGSIVTNGLAQAGFRVRRLVRKPRPDSDDVRYEIGSGCSSEALDGVDVLVHCAYDFSVTSPTAIWQANVLGTRSLLSVAESSQVRRTIFISSMSAFPGTQQIYGRAKLASEMDAFARGMCAVRPGLVYGPHLGGMAGTLSRLTSLPIVPLVGRNAYQFTVHEEDLRRAIVVLATAEVVPSVPLGLAHREPVPFEYLLRSIASVEGDQKPRFIPVPWPPVYWGLRAAELTTVKLPVRADSLLGLVKSAGSVPNPDEVSRLDITFRPFSL
jgi:nucleoside-diphosphate-sugar epimerase